MKTISIISLILTIVGALNWGLIGLLDFNLVTFLLGEDTLATMLVYDLVGISALVNIRTLIDLIQKV